MYHFIVNPASRSGRGLKTWETVETELKKRGTDYRVYFTKEAFDATKTARRIASHHPRTTIVGLGGDGTIHEIINGLQDHPDITFACIPTGSGNDFVRGASWPKDPLAGLARILDGPKKRRMDTGLMEYDHKKRSFGVSCGIGFDAAICLEALTSPLKKVLNKINLGKLTYILIALKQLVLYKPTPITIILDGYKKIHFEKCYFLSVMNKKYEGGGLKICPHASDEDGMLDICVVGNLSKAKIFLVFPTAFFGRHLIFDGVHSYRCSSVDIRSAVPLPVHADGESCKKRTHLKVTSAPSSLKITI